MKKKLAPEHTETKVLFIMVLEELMERAQRYCNERDMTVKEFGTNVIIEKLKLAYKERRKKFRL